MGRSVSFWDIICPWAILWTITSNFLGKTGCVGHQKAHKKQFTFLSDSTLIVGDQAVHVFNVNIIRFFREIFIFVKDETFAKLCLSPFRTAERPADSGR